MKRFATKEEQEVINQANKLLESVKLEVTELKDKNGGAVLPSKGI